MNKEHFDLNLVPTWRQGYRFQFEPAQNGFGTKDYLNE